MDESKLKYKTKGDYSVRKITSENVYISSFQASKIYSHNFRDESIKYNKIGSIPLSLEIIKLKKEGFNIHTSKLNGKLTSRDIINVDFKFKSDSSEDVVKKTLKKLHSIDKNLNPELYERLNNYIEYVKAQNWESISNEDLRKYFYKNGFSIYQKDYNTHEISEIKYVFYKRSGSKSRTGRALFIREELHDVMEKWSNMELDIKEEDDIDLAGIMAYQSMVSSGIKYTVKIPTKNIFLISDIDSIFKHTAKVIKTNKDGFLDSFTEEVNISNSLFDGQSLLSPHFFKNEKSMVLLRNHFFKSAGFKCNIQKFLMDNCPNNIKYEDWRLKDMFGNTIYAKNIHMITTPNSLKALKFNHLLGDNKTQNDMYKYWKQLVKQDGEVFGVCKNEYSSKRGENLQQMSYQMLNSMTLSKQQVKELCQFEINFIEKLKNDDETYIKYLESTNDEINSNMLWVELYKINNKIANTKQFKEYRKKKISAYVTYVKGGKIRLNGDYCVMIGNPLEMLLHSINKLPCKKGIIDSNFKGILKENQMYTKLHGFNKEYTCYRNPHTGKNNIGILFNIQNKMIEKYFDLSKNMVVVNAINFPLQDIFSSCDYDSDCIALFDNNTLLDSAKKCFNIYPISFNSVSADKNKYKYSNEDKARLDNILSKSQRYIGEVVNLGQLCMSKYHHSETKNEELLKKIDVMTVLSCICIDLAKKFYDIDIAKEIEHVRGSKFITENGKITKPLFWSYVSDGVNKDKLVKHNTPMDYLVEILSEIPIAIQREDIELLDLIKEQSDKKNTDRKQIIKVESMLEIFVKNIKKINSIKDMDKETRLDSIKKETATFNKRLEKIKIRDNTMIELVMKLIKNNIDINMTLNALLVQNSFKNIWKTL